MIENGTNELRGQTELTDFLPRNEPTETVPDGYDAEGHLLNEDYPPTQKPSPLGKVDFPENACVVSGKTDEVSTPTAADPNTSAVPANSNSTLHSPHSTLPASDRLSTLAGEIAAITEHARVVLASAAIDIGKRLIEAKGLVPEGRWGEWLEKNVDYSDRQAQVMMQLADQFGRGELPEAFRGLGISHMTALLAAPAEEREALARRVEEESLSVRDLKDEVKRLKRENGDQQLVIDGLRKENDQIRDDGEHYQKNADALEEELKAAHRMIEKHCQDIKLAQAKATAAEASAEELRRLHSDAEDRAAASAQRASDAVNRANQTAKDLAAARAEIARLEAEKAAAPEAEVKEVEVVPEDVQKELSDLRAQLAEAKANVAATNTPPEGPNATDRFKWFYANQMKPTFTSALILLREVAQEDAKAADLFATALVKGCQQLMNQLRES